MKMKIENINLIRKIVWSFYHTTHIDWDELFSEACLAYFNALKTFDPQQGKITTYVWHCISNHLKSYLQQERRYRQLFEEPLTITSTEENINPLEEFVAAPPNHFAESLSQDASTIVNLITERPHEFDLKVPSEIRKTIAITLTIEGWSKARIRNAFNDLQLALQT